MVRPAQLVVSVSQGTAGLIMITMDMQAQEITLAVQVQVQVQTATIVMQMHDLVRPHISRLIGAMVVLTITVME